METSDSGSVASLDFCLLLMLSLPSLPTNVDNDNRVMADKKRDDDEQTGAGVCTWCLVADRGSLFVNPDVVGRV